MRSLFPFSVDATSRASRSLAANDALPRSGRRTLRTAMSVVALGLSTALMASCTIRDIVGYMFGPNQIMESMKPEFSYNVLNPPWWWPDEDTFGGSDRRQGQAQREYFGQHGRPDFLRIWYNAPGVVLPRNVVWSRKALPQPKGVSWVYMGRELEVTFAGAQAVENPINDEVKTICTLGDPDEIKMLSNDPTQRSVRYVYWRDGLQIDFVDFERTAMRQERELPGWTR